MLACKLPRTFRSSRAPVQGAALSTEPERIGMAKCTYCGAETELHSGAVPICLVCAVDLEPQRKPPLPERLHGRRTASRQSGQSGSAADDSIACPECARLEADRQQAIQRYVDLRAARQCLLRECPSLAPALDAVLVSVEIIVNEAWRKLAEHQASHSLAASA